MHEQLHPKMVAIWQHHKLASCLFVCFFAGYIGKGKQKCNQATWWASALSLISSQGDMPSSCPAMHAAMHVGVA